MKTHHHAVCVPLGYIINTRIVSAAPKDHFGGRHRSVVVVVLANFLFFLFFQNIEHNRNHNTHGWCVLYILHVRLFLLLDFTRRGVCRRKRAHNSSNELFHSLYSREIAHKMYYFCIKNNVPTRITTIKTVGRKIINLREYHNGTVRTPSYRCPFLTHDKAQIGKLLVLCYFGD